MANDGKMTLVTGGSRSGKSRYAQELCEKLTGGRVYLAACQRIDGDSELDERIQRHQDDRAGRGWTTVEEPIAMADVIASLDADTVLLDCVTMWINNLLYAAEQREELIEEDYIAEVMREFGETVRRSGMQVVVVTNEVGSGIVPADSATRLYRDCVGRANQLLAEMANEVTLVCCGLPLVLKHSNATDS